MSTPNPYELSGMNFKGVHLTFEVHATPRDIFKAVAKWFKDKPEAYVESYSSHYDGEDGVIYVTVIYSE